MARDMLFDAIFNNISIYFVAVNFTGGGKYPEKTINLAQVTIKLHNNF